MKKSNVAIFALLAVASVFLLWLWYYLRLNEIDEPLDLVLSIVWWVVIVAAIVAIVKVEQVRRRRIRTVYVADGTTFNSEKGLMRFEGVKPMQDIISSILENLEYNFSRVDFPEREQFDVKYFVRTKEYRVEKSDTEQMGDAPDSAGDPAEQRKWTGEVVVVETKEERPFETPEELAAILASLERVAA